MKYVYKSELYHHGILGQKWGDRNGPPYPLGSSDHSASEKKAGWKKSIDSGDQLSNRKKKKVSKEYQKLSKKTMNEYNRNVNRLNRETERRTDQELRDTNKYDEFNAEQKEKYGDDYVSREGYYEDFEKIYNQVRLEKADEVLLDFYNNSKNYAKAEEFSDKYSMDSWDALAKDNKETIDNLVKIVEENKKKK